MRLRISHEIAASFSSPSSHSVREIRLFPRTFDGQYVDDWRIDVDQDCRLEREIDPFGNVVHTFSVIGPIDELVIVAVGEVEVDDTAGILQTTMAEKLPPTLYLRETRLTLPNPAMRQFVAEIAEKSGNNTLDRCHQLMGALHDRFDFSREFDLSDPSGMTASEAFAAEKPTVGAVALLFVACARMMDIPARVVSGYLYSESPSDSATHAWAEAFVPGLGWIGFDPAENQCPTDAYVRMACGLDCEGAAYIRGADNTSGDISATSRASIQRIDL